MAETVLVKPRRPARIFPGWWAVVTGSFMNLWGAGFSTYGLSALFKPMSTELGMSRAATSVVTSIARLEGGIEGPVVGWFVDKLGPRKVGLVGVFLFGLGFILMYFVNSLWSFYLVWGIIIGIGQNMGSGLPIMKAITNWFVRKRGLALGLRMMLTAALLTPLVTFFITTWGWRMACVIGGLGMWLVGLPLFWFGVKDQRPEFYGLLPDGAAPGEKTADVNQMIERGAKYASDFDEVEFSARQAVRTGAYWLLIVVQIGQAVGTQSLLVHFVPFLTDIGMSPAKAAATVSLAGIASIISRFVSGLVADRLGKNGLRFFMGGAFLLQAFGIAIFVWKQTISMVYPFLILYFFSMGIGLVLNSVIAGRYFGRKAFGLTRGISTIATMPLSMAAPVYLGWVYDTTGSYVTGFVTVAGVLVVAAIAMVLARPPKPPAQITDIHQIM